MRGTPLAIAAVTALGAIALPSAASANEVQVGQTSSSLVAPTCPTGTTASSCTILLTEETGVQTLSNGVRSPEAVTKTGDLSAFYVGISAAASQYTANLDKPTSQGGYGGPPQVALTVLRPVYTGAVRRYEVAAEGPLENLTNYQGHVIEFSLPQELPVVKGEVLALTTPTWAPVLSIQMGTTFSYTQSRVGNCAGEKGKPAYYNPQLSLGDVTSYGCAFPNTRVEYSATEITTPTVNAAYRIARRVRHGAALVPRIVEPSRHVATSAQQRRPARR